MAEDAARPNIRIEIHNNLAEESMEVDVQEKVSENEDGEISDANEEDCQEALISRAPLNHPGNRLWPNSGGGFTTGINIFDKEEQEKLSERAKRFQLNPEEIKNFTDTQLQELHESLGLSEHSEKDVRFEAIYMRGTDDMSTEDVLDYFRKYCPIGIEWINDESCNVVWEDNISPARALFYLSSEVSGMPVTGPCDPFLNDDNNDDNGRSVLLRNSEREVKISDGDVPDNKENSGIVHVSDIKVPIPPGYWRLGVEHSKSKCILLRFSFKTDKKPYKAEKFSEYYRKYGNPNFGGMRGIISESHRMKNKGIFDRNYDIHNKNQTEEDSKNPWGSLAENWYEDAQFAERVVVPEKPKRVDESSGIMKRLGFKRAHEEEEEKEEDTKKTKIPRMRMYADEEEEKIKRRRKLQAVKLQATLKKEDEPQRSDLRSILKSADRTTAVEHVNEEDYDLGSKLKNRNRRFNISKPSHYQPKPIEISIDNTNSYTKVKPDRHKSIYGNMRSDRFNKRNTRKERDYYEEEDEFDQQKPRSKVAVVIKTHKKPTVASMVCSRLHSDREEKYKSKSIKSRIRRASTSNSEDSSSRSASSSSDSSESETENGRHIHTKSLKHRLGRPGFKTSNKNLDHKSPLRIEINNDHFKKE